jgi:AcrR family transcriptional regulator
MAVHSSPPVAQQARGRARRAAIVDAAVALFSTHGFRGTSVAAVAERAGVTDAGVLYHFKTKDELLLAVLAHFDEGYERAVNEVLALGGLEALKLIALWGHEMEASADLTALYVVLSAEHLRDESPVRAYFAARYARLLERNATLFQEAIERGELRPDLDPAAEASALLAHLDGIRLQWFFTNGRVSIADSVWRYVTTMLERLAI